MASGRSHDRACVFAAIPTAIATFNYLNPTQAAAVCIGYAIGSIWLSPDIDLKQSRPSRRWGMLNGIWRPYRRMVPHRGISHVPIAGTISRLAYLGVPIAAILFLSNTWDQVLWDRLIWLAIGCEISAWVHLAMDYSPGLRKL